MKPSDKKPNDLLDGEYLNRRRAFVGNKTWFDVENIVVDAASRLSTQPNLDFQLPRLTDKYNYLPESFGDTPHSPPVFGRGVGLGRVGLGRLALGGPVLRSVISAPTAHVEFSEQCCGFPVGTNEVYLANKLSPFKGPGGGINKATVLINERYGREKQAFEHLPFSCQPLGNTHRSLLVEHGFTFNEFALSLTKEQVHYRTGLLSAKKLGYFDLDKGFGYIDECYKEETRLMLDYRNPFYNPSSTDVSDPHVDLDIVSCYAYQPIKTHREQFTHSFCEQLFEEYNPMKVQYIAMGGVFKSYTGEFDPDKQSNTIKCDNYWKRIGKVHDLK